jgi:hypothetical protein
MRRVLQAFCVSLFTFVSCSPAQIAGKGVDLIRASETHPSRVEQAAEKGETASKELDKHPAGAEAHPLFCCICGPTKVVPCYKTAL